MKLLSRQTDYAINALCFMARHKGTVSAADVQKELGMPRAFIRGILLRLAKAGFLCSRRGPHGGFTLAGVPARITVLQVMQEFQTDTLGVHCAFRKLPCPRKSRCRLRSHLSVVNNLLCKRLQKITIGSLERVA